MDKDLISVIVPIYNVEKYLSKCIKSIINQTYKNLEIILIDDGSLDNSFKICNYFKNKDLRIKVIHKKNEGVASARNDGLKNATGKYITFVDPDDYVTNDYIKYLYELLIKTNADIACCNFEYQYTEKDIKLIEVKEKIKEFNSKEALKNLLYQKEIDTSCWGKIYKKEVFERIQFPVGKIYEDFATIYKTIIKSKKIVYSNQKKYIYMQRNTSIIGSEFNSKNFDIIELAIVLEQDLLNYDKTLKLAIDSRILNMDFYIIRIINKKLYREQYESIKKDIKKRRKNLLKDKNLKLKTKIAIYISFINIDLIKYLYYFLKKIKFAGVSKYLTKYKK